MENTGIFIYTTLIEVDAITGVPTGATKPNIPGDIDYIPPQQNLQSCPISTTTTTTIKFDKDFDNDHDNDHN